MNPYDEKTRAKQIYLANNHIVINVVFEYNIALSHCDTANKLLFWISHLTEKAWMTMDVMGEFIEIACRENSIKMMNA